MILDTNALSDVAEHEPAALEVVARAGRVVVPVIVLGEYRLGIVQSRFQALYESWLREFMATATVLSVDDDTTHHYAAIGLELKRAGRPIPTNDIWIAALCRQHSEPLLSRDRHFDAVRGLTRISW